MSLLHLSSGKIQKRSLLILPWLIKGIFIGLIIGFLIEEIVSGIVLGCLMGITIGAGESAIN